MVLTIIHDCVAKNYSFPHTSVNEATAKRDFAQMSKTPGFPVNDVELIKVADFDANTGALVLDRATIIPRPIPEK